jgi:hypothetical protein
VTQKRSPKRRGPAKRYAPETTDVTPVKKPRRKAVAKKGSNAIIQTATASTVITVPEYPTPSTSPSDGSSEASRVPAYFQNYPSRIMEELERVTADKERLIEQMTNYFIERRFLISRIKELENPSENDFMDQVISLAHDFKLKKRGSSIVRDAIMAAEVSEPESQTQPAYPVGQPEQIVYYSQSQNFQQNPEPYRGVKDVLLSAPSGTQKRVALPISSLGPYQSQNQVHQNFN